MNKKERRQRIRRKWKEGWRRNGGRIEGGRRKGERKCYGEGGGKEKRKERKQTFFPSLIPKPSLFHKNSKTLKNSLNIWNRYHREHIMEIFSHFRFSISSHI